MFVITQLGYRHPFDLLRSYLRYRRLAVKAARVPGLLSTRFLIESPRTCYTLSIWKDLRSIALFGTLVEDHPPAVREAIGRLRWSKQGPETWSAKLIPITLHERLGKPVGFAIGAQR